MTDKELAIKADLNDKKIVLLAMEDTIQEGDYVEWMPETFTTVDKGSRCIGKKLKSKACGFLSARRLV